MAKRTQRRRRRQNPADSGSSSILKIALIGGAAYLLYNMFYGSSTVTTTSTTQTTTTAPATQQTLPANTTPASQTNASAPVTSSYMPIPSAAQLDSAASAAGYGLPHSFNTYQWNYFYTAVTGKPTPNFGPDQLYPGDANNQTDLHTSTDYVNALAAWANGAGLAGVSRNVLDSTGFRRGSAVYGWS